MKLAYKLKNLLNKRRAQSAPEFPRSIILEPTNACNLRCRMCPIYGIDVEKKREVGYMERQIWTNVIDEIGSWPVQVDLDVHGAGEPLLHPEFFDILTYAKTKDNIRLGFLCNGTLLDMARAKAVVEIGVDWVCFSVDGCEKEIFEYYRRGALLESVENNIRYLVSVRKNGKPHIRLNMVHHTEANVDLFIDSWTGIVDALIVSRKRPVRREENRRLKLVKPCLLLYQQLVIGWPGKTVLCCEDLWGDFVTGDFPQRSLYEIWHGKVFERARRIHEARKSDTIDLCLHCDAQMFHRQDVRMVERNSISTTIVRELDEMTDDVLVNVQ